MTQWLLRSNFEQKYRQIDRIFYPFLTVWVDMQCGMGIDFGVMYINQH